MEKINELDVAKVTKLDGSSWKKKIIILAIILILVGSGVLIWGFGFHGFLYKELQSKTKDLYISIFVKHDQKINQNNFTSDGLKKYEEIKIELDKFDEYWKNHENEKEQRRTYTPVVKVESLKTNDANNMIFAVTDLSFVDNRKEISDDERLSKAIFFKFKKNKQVFDILYRVKDLKEIED